MKKRLLFRVRRSAVGIICFIAAFLMFSLSSTAQNFKNPQQIVQILDDLVDDLREEASNLGTSQQLGSTTVGVASPSLELSHQHNYLAVKRKYVINLRNLIGYEGDVSLVFDRNHQAFMHQLSNKQDMVNQIRDEVLALIAD